jgi:peptide methionine sulfoxide reductase MsrA
MIQPKLIFYYNQQQKEIAEGIIKILQEKGYEIATALRPVEPFWIGEEYHRDYYNHKGTLPYCHGYTKRF